jgi:hypothetical protein
MKFEFEKRIEYIFDGWNVILEKATEGSPATAGNTILTNHKEILGLRPLWFYSECWRSRWFISYYRYQK